MWPRRGLRNRERHRLPALRAFSEYEVVGVDQLDKHLVLTGRGNDRDRIQAHIPASTCADWSASQTAMAHGTAATTITSTSIPDRQKSVVRQARAGGFAGSTHSFQTEL